MKKSGSNNFCSTFKIKILLSLLMITMLLMTACETSVEEKTSEAYSEVTVELLDAAFGNSMNTMVETAYGDIDETFCTATDDDDLFWDSIKGDGDILEHRDEISIFTVSFNVKNPGETPVVIGYSEVMDEDIKIAFDNSELKFSSICMYAYRENEQWLMEEKEIYQMDEAIECRIGVIVPKELRENEDKSMTLTIFGQTFDIREFIAYNSLSEEEKGQWRMEKKALELGLKDVEVLYNNDGDGANLTCSNFNELDAEKMLEVLAEIENEAGTYITTVYVGSDEYEVDTFSRKIYLNGSLIYDDYESSDAYKYEKEEEEAEQEADFTNRYGTPTTKCATSGCSNYIASSGDTWNCPAHSNKCLECGNYCDGDAMYCGECLHLFE